MIIKNSSFKNGAKKDTIIFLHTKLQKTTLKRPNRKLFFETRQHKTKKPTKIFVGLAVFFCLD